MTGERALGRFEASLDVTLRLARETDLEALEWFGAFREHREIIRDAFERQRRGENLMILAVANRFPVGQAWADLTRYAGRGTALLWAVRVLEPFRGLGLGSRLIAAAERELALRGFRWAEIGVEKHNEGARRLYERLGYRVWRELHEEYGYTTPEGARVRIPIEEWMLRKELAAPAAREPIRIRGGRSTPSREEGRGCGGS